MSIASSLLFAEQIQPFLSEDFVEIRTTEHVLSILFSEDQLEKLSHERDAWQEILTKFQDAGADTLQLDFRNVRFISSSALNKIVSLKLNVGMLGGKIVLCNLNEMIRDVFRKTRLDKILKIAD